MYAMLWMPLVILAGATEKCWWNSRRHDSQLSFLLATLCCTHILGFLEFCFCFDKAWYATQFFAWNTLLSPRLITIVPQVVLSHISRGSLNTEKVQQKTPTENFAVSKTTFTFHISILTLSNAFFSINKREMKSESGYSFAMASKAL